jgi:integrase
MLVVRILAFPGDSAALGVAEKRRRRTRRSPYSFSVVSATMPSGEGLPLLVSRETWVPASLALRWTVLKRRYECAESTLRRDLNGLRYVYAWGSARFSEGLDARLERQGLDYNELIRLRDFVARPDTVDDSRPDAETDLGVGADTSAGARALAAKMFLTWAVSPASRNQRGAEPFDALRRIGQIEAVLGPLANTAGEGGLVEPLNESIARRVDQLLAPIADADGHFVRPLRWHKRNPFKADVRLRNWLMWNIARDCGLRVGEMLSLRVDDFPMVRGDRCLRVVRRPDAKEDVRKKRPAVKTAERAVPMSEHGQFALRAYLTERPPLGRRSGTVYLFTSRRDRPLSANAADRVTKVVSMAIEARVHWHAVRHAWATDIARGVLLEALSGERSAGDAEAQKALLTENLRVLGGWSDESKMPMYYARVAIKEYADAKLRVRQNERVSRMLKRTQLDEPL